MKRMAVSFGAVVCCLLLPRSHRRGSPTNFCRAPQVHLRLLTSLTTAVAKNGDPFVAEVAQPVYLAARYFAGGSTCQGLSRRSHRSPAVLHVHGQAALVLIFAISKSTAEYSRRK